MRGVGGPLLCIGDLLSDVGGDNNQGSAGGGWAHQEGDEYADASPSSPSSPTVCVSISSSPLSTHPLRPSDLPQLFEDNYSKLIESLEGDDHSWTALTLKLCAALKMANKLVNSANSNIESLVEKVEALESILKRGDSAVATASAIKYADNKEKH